MHVGTWRMALSRIWGTICNKAICFLQGVNCYFRGRGGQLGSPWEGVSLLSPLKNIFQGLLEGRDQCYTIPFG